MFNDGWCKFFGLMLTARGWVVDECRIGADEDIVVDSKSVPKLHAAFDGCPVSDGYVVFYKDMVANIAVIPNDGSWKNVSECPYPSSSANTGSFANSFWVQKISHFVYYF